MTVDLDQQLVQMAEQVDVWTRDAITQSLSTEADRLRALLEYHLGWRDTALRALETPAASGKKLRPALVLLVAQAVCGEIPLDAQAAAVAVELIHNFSLVHDDIQDRSTLRRFRPTVWSQWGMPQAINAGDALFALAQLVISRARSELAAAMAHELNATALLLAEGQFLDIDLQDGQTAVTLDAYETMILRKTGVLFAAACRLGAMAAGATSEQHTAYAAFGRELGIAFQEQDDILGVWGTSRETGKPEAADIVERKRGLPAVLALARPDAPAWLHAVYAPVPVGGSGQDAVDAPDAETIGRVIAHFDALGLRAEVEERVRLRYARALLSLEAAQPRDPWRGYLSAICGSLLARRT